MKIAICYLAHHRLLFFNLFVSIISNIKQENKNKVELHILCSREWNVSDELLNRLSESNIKFLIHDFPYGTNYKLKLNKIASIDCDYYVKIDDDTFFNNHVWDYMIENAHRLDDYKNVCMTPLLNNGIPTVERFIECFLTNEEKKHIYNLFLVYNLNMHWGVDYSRLNINGGWNPDLFFHRVEIFNHHYKGIHPVRVSQEAHNYILECLFKRFEDFNKKRIHKPISKNYPYMCNSVMLIKSDIWKKILTDESLFVDMFDEVPLNKYKDGHNMNFLLIDNSMGINTGYNTIDNFKIFEKTVYNKLNEAYHEM